MGFEEVGGDLEEELFHVAVPVMGGAVIAALGGDDGAHVPVPEFSDLHGGGLARAFGNYRVSFGAVDHPHPLAKGRVASPLEGEGKGG
ncbi:hypothetical protein GCM10011529_05580 [Polymorphobacter glacialis]|uniref:Uncharacterized protein n=1 Tax=Sandarakinorhabdus glacialis TaxID=1614636 RepID=A0A917E476_9SPHN|nr:hypothetical protein GCM10011529_05580 [Polymorphobacter glacialis]